MAVKNFTEVVYGIVRRIPKGSVLTYQEVARRAGRPLAARAVGNILNKNKNMSIPCHRVIMSSGKIGGYNGIRGEKAELLKAEGSLKLR